MITAEEMRNLSQSNYRKDAIKTAIEHIENNMKRAAKNQRRETFVSFYEFPGNCDDFCNKYGEAARKEYYRTYNVEQEVKEAFKRQGFSFKLITDDICGGVRQDPYWVICW